MNCQPATPGERFHHVLLAFTHEHHAAHHRQLRLCAVMCHLSRGLLLCPSYKALEERMRILAGLLLIGGLLWFRR